MLTQSVRHRSHGFTLVELLIVIAIVSVLISLLTPAVHHALTSGRRVKELVAVRELTSALHRFGVDHDDQLMVGLLDTDAVDAWPTIRDPYGNVVGNYPKRRYPWRLTDYLKVNLAGSVMVNDQQAFATPVGGAAATWHILVSVHPSFGYNSHFLGGFHESGNPGLVQPTMRISDVAAGSSVITFASARAGGSDSDRLHGFHTVDSPNYGFNTTTSSYSQWSSQPWDASGYAEDWGNLDLRFNDKAVVAMVDGHAEMLDETQLRDMTHWSPAAARLHSQDWQP